MPELNWHTYQTYEKEVGKVMELLAQETCLAAALEERRLTIENAEDIKKLLPAHLDLQSIFPDASMKSILDKSIDDKMVVRIAVSFDMGWFTRGTGRTYDSLSGTAALIGYYSKKVITFVTLNRKCAKCDRGHDKGDHDCRCNFTGSAKAMEPKAAVLLTKNNPILVARKLEVGIFIADNDSSSISAVRQACDHEVPKQSDKNHTTKGVVNALYKIQKSHKELNSVAIQYLKKCFTYCVSQNQGNSLAMASAIKNIPYHCFNFHNNCGDWCNYKTEQENYVHSNIGDGFHSDILFNALKDIFNSLSTKSSQFVSNASSNANESLNAMIVSKAPKTRLYGKTASSDIRVASAINKKNFGEKYNLTLAEKLSLSPGKYSAKYYGKVDSFHKKRYAKSVARSTKLRRLALKKSKTGLKNRKETEEGITYESNIGLCSVEVETIPIATFNLNSKSIIIFFDLETGGLSKSSDILQLAAKYKDYEFSVYIKPAQKISEEASGVHGLRLTDGVLQLHGKPVLTISLSEALLAFYEFLCLFKKPCILTAHNCAFDRPRLMAAFEKVFMTKHFQSIVHGFCDTLRITRRITGKNSKGSNKLETLAQLFDISCNKAHDALQDVVMLQQVVEKLKIKNSDLYQNVCTWSDVERKIQYSKNLPNFLKNLTALDECLSLNMRKKLVAAQITYDMVIDAFEKEKFEGLLNLFGEDENGFVKVTKNKQILDKLYAYLQNLLDIVSKPNY
ncbi:uncharacterized protein LOC111643363 [Copidosoma floridanum]|uniref:uncharacterized protein LOC111643363 n=1 Tax=Copidosoma floridanum TaxID=29053 RepID=UPI000C6F5266|nr:uncharacterized protein LOC111643363 [Copidosoma floridanum]